MRPTRVEIDLSAIQSNYRTACLLAPRSRNLAVIKANAYGHGAVMTARALEPQVPAFAVAFLEEALELRRAGVRVQTRRYVDRDHGPAGCQAGC